MSELEIINSITARFSQEFSNTSVEYPNHRINTDSLDHWIRISVQFSKTERRSLKTGKVIRGFVNFQSFSRLDQGLGLVTENAIEAANVFEFQNINGVIFGAKDIVVVNRAVSTSIATTETQWFQVNSFVPFTKVE